MKYFHYTIIFSGDHKKHVGEQHCSMSQQNIGDEEDKFVYLLKNGPNIGIKCTNFVIEKKRRRKFWKMHTTKF